MLLSLPAWIGLATGVPTFWLLPRRFRLRLLALLSAGILALWAPLTVLALGTWSTAFYLLVGREQTRRWATPTLIVGLFAQLAWFKYLLPVRAALFSGSSLDQLVVPLGISFFTFKLVHYGLERARGGLPEHGLDTLLAYVFLFPIYSAGPIERFEHFTSQQQQHWSWDHLAVGGTRIVHGLVKKLVISDLLLSTLLPLKQGGVLTGLETWSNLEAWQFVGVSFLTLYMDFSGYCDIAIGASRLFGLRITENFEWPILARSISDFWKRWHISLAQWCQAYVYMPAIGLSRNPFVAVYATFGVMGLWHAASVPWLMWGAFHATGLSLSLLWTRLGRRVPWLRQRSLGWLGVPPTLAFVTAAHGLTTLHGQGGLEECLRLLARLAFLQGPSL